MLCIQVRNGSASEWIDVHFGDSRSKPDTEGNLFAGRLKFERERFDETRTVDDVIMVQADGDELVHILENSVNLPSMNQSACQRWFGDHAKWIVANIRFY